MASAHQVILVVEDDVDIREAIREILEDQGYRVFSAGNGQEALDVLRDIPKPNLVLLDLMMPVMDGHQFLEIFRSQSAYQAVPVVVVSAGITVAPSIAGFIKKPFDTSALLKTVEKHCLQATSQTAGTRSDGGPPSLNERAI